MSRLHVTPFTPRTHHHARPSLVDLALAAALLVAGSWGFLRLLADLPSGWSLVFWAPVIGGAVGTGVVLATKEGRP